MSVTETLMEDGWESMPSFVTHEADSREPLTALHAAWQDSALHVGRPEADRDFQRTLFWQCVSEARGAMSDKSKQRQLQDFGEACDYLWFGDQNTPLPQALVQAELPGMEMPLLAFKPESLSNYEYFNVADNLDHFGFGKLRSYRAELLRRQAAERLEPLAYSIVTNTPAYRLLESFIVPQREWRERTLSAQERHIEERALEERVRRQFGLASSDNLALHASARDTLGRAVQRLEEQTRLSPVDADQTGSPLTRARTFFWEIAAELQRSSGALQNVEILEREEPVDWSISGHRPSSGKTKQVRSILITTERETARWDPTSFGSWLESEIDGMATNARPYLRFVAEQLFANMVLDVFDEQIQPRDYSLLLEQCASKLSLQLCQQLEAFALAQKSRASFSSLATLLVAPTESTARFDSYVVTVPLAQSHNTFVTKKEIRQAMQGARGIVKARPVTDQTQRLIQYTHKNHELPADMSGADLLIEWAEDDVYDLRIPGYELMARDGALFGFASRPEADPYAECTVPINAEAQHELAVQYARAGLSALALSVQNAANLTVAQLTNLIAAHTEYVVPGSLQIQPRPAAIEDYAPFVKNGTLALQCVGAAHLVHLSLRSIFGKGASAVLDGDVLLSFSRTIPKVGHMQTGFTDPHTGATYILDGTPAGRSWAFWRQRLQHRLGQLRSQLASPDDVAAALERRRPPIAQQAGEMILSVVAESTPRGQQEQRALQAERIRDNLLLNLRIIFGANGQLVGVEDMLAHIASLNDEDVLFRVFSAVWITAEGGEQAPEAQRILKFLVDLRTCEDESLLRMVDPKHYSRQTRLITALQQALNGIMKLPPADVEPEDAAQ